MDISNYLFWRAISYGSEIAGLVGLISVTQTNTTREAIIRGTLSASLYIAGRVLGESIYRQKHKNIP